MKAVELPTTSGVDAGGFASFVCAGGEGWLAGEIGEVEAAFRGRPAEIELESGVVGLSWVGHPEATIEERGMKRKAVQ